MRTSRRDLTVNRCPVARVQRAGLIPDNVPRMRGAARGILLLLLAAVVVGGAIWGYLGKSDTEPSADLSQMMEQATEGASQATDAASEAVESVADGASDAAETTKETIAGIGEEIQTQTDEALGGVGEATEQPVGEATEQPIGEATEQPAESVSESESFGGLAEPAPGTSGTENEGVGDVITDSASEPLATGEPPTTATAPETASPAPSESTVSEPVATPAPEQVAPTETLAVTEPAIEATAPESTSTGSETIIVKPGEYLYSIAKRIYGDASKWRLIYDANRDQLSNPDAVRVGMKLVVPATN